MRVVSIDVGSYSIKVAEATMDSKEVVIEQLFQKTLNPDPAHDTELEVLEYLREFVQNYDTNETRFVLSVKQEHISGRIKEFPFREKQKILRSLPFELEDDIPFSQRVAIFDAKIIQTKEDVTSVYACACPKEEIQNILNFSHDVQIFPDVLTIDAMALGNFVDHWQKTSPEITSDYGISNEKTNAQTEEKSIGVILNMGHRRTLALFYDKNTKAPITARSLPWGGHDVVITVAQVYQLPYIEALKEVQKNCFVLLNHDGASTDQITYSETVKDILSELGKSLRLVFMDIQSQWNGSIKDLKFTGGSSQIKNLNVYLTQQLEIPCNPFQFLSNFQTSDKSLKTPANEMAYSLAIALTIEGFKTPRNPPINFLKDEFAKESKKFKNLWTKWQPTAAFIAIAFTIFFIYGISREFITEELNTKTDDVFVEQAKKIANLPTRRATVSNVRKFIKKEKSYSKKQEQLKAIMKTPSALDIFKKINDSLPGKNISKLDLTHFQIKDDDVSIKGYAQRQDIPKIKSALSLLSSNKKVTSSSSNKRSLKGQTYFSFKFKYSRN